jgi:hypothetical protein
MLSPFRKSKPGHKTHFEFTIEGENGKWGTDLADTKLTGQLGAELLVPFLSQMMKELNVSASCTLLVVNGTALGLGDLKRPIKEFVRPDSEEPTSVHLGLVLTSRSAGRLKTGAASHGVPEYTVAAGADSPSGGSRSRSVPDELKFDGLELMFDQLPVNDN